MKQLNFSPVLRAPDGVVQTLSQGKSLGNSLANATEGDALKYWHWAQELHKSGIIEVDMADWETIKTFVSTTPTLPNWIKGQLLETLLAARPEK